MSENNTGMKVGLYRKGLWIVAIIISTIAIFFFTLIRMMISDGVEVAINAPAKMKSAFSEGLSSRYNIVIVENEDEAQISVGYSKEQDENYVKFAFSPFIIGYSADQENYNKLKDAEVLIPFEYNKELYDIDFLKIVNEITQGEGLWKNLGINELGQIRVLYPSPSTGYWGDFYNFMLVTVNNGRYPLDEHEMKEAMEIIKKFENSIHTEAIDNLDEKIKRMGGFPENAFIIFPESLIIQVAIDNKYNAKLLYPTNTVYLNYYITAKDDESKDMLNKILQTERFYAFLNYYAWCRNEENLMLDRDIDDSFGKREAYNVVKISK